MKPERQDKRTTISLATVVWDMAEEMMARKGFNENFSAYVADLVRRDQERAAAMEMRDAPSSKGSTDHPVVEIVKSYRKRAPRP